MKPTLLILAAGMASRYGSMKQTEGFGPSGETIMDYSIYDAIRAGFGKVVFIIRKDFAQDFEPVFNKKLQGKIDVEYVYQEMNLFVPPGHIPTERAKPWGTGHAVLCAKDVIHEPFAVINADDFYGQAAFVQAAEFLNKTCNESTYAILGYELQNTLSKHGTVSRGVCAVDNHQNLMEITERTKIYETNDQGIVYEEADQIVPLAGATTVSMNFWGFHPNIFKLTEALFLRFVADNKGNPKAEYFIPIIADAFIKEAGNTIKVITTSAQWFGVTYKEDAEAVKERLNKLIEAKIYPENLWA